MVQHLSRWSELFERQREEERAGTADPAVKLMLLYIVLSACRFGGAAGAEWAEVNWDKKLWLRIRVVAGRPDRPDAESQQHCERYAWTTERLHRITKSSTI